METVRQIKMNTSDYDQVEWIRKQLVNEQIAYIDVC